MAARQDAIALLKADHRTVESLFEKYQEAGGAAAKRRIAHRICLELTVHTQIEEEIFYPAVRGKIEEADVLEAYIEHDAAKLLIADIEAADPKEDLFFDAKVKVLSEQIKHHVHEEEAFLSGMFSQARRTDLDMRALGAELADRKKALVADYRETLPKPKTTSLKARTSRRHS